MLFWYSLVKQFRSCKNKRNFWKKECKVPQRCGKGFVTNDIDLHSIVWDSQRFWCRECAVETENHLEATRWRLTLQTTILPLFLTKHKGYSLNNFVLWISVCILIDKFCCCSLSMWLFCIVLVHLLFSIFSDIRAEMMPDTLPDRSEVAKFDHGKLKHVETQQKEVLPTKSGAVTGLS